MDRIIGGGYMKWEMPAFYLLNVEVYLLSVILILFLKKKHFVFNSCELVEYSTIIQRIRSLIYETSPVCRVSLDTPPRRDFINLKK